MQRDPQLAFLSSVDADTPDIDDDSFIFRLQATTSLVPIEIRRRLPGAGRYCKRACSQEKSSETD